MNIDLRPIVLNTVRQILSGFFFTSGGILALAVFQRFLHIGLCP